MRLVAAMLSLAAVISPRIAAGSELVGRQATGENFIEICPNPEYQGLNETVTCMNITNPTVPRGYGGRTCSGCFYIPSHSPVDTIDKTPDLVSLTYTPLRVGSPQGISSARMFGVMNCTLYKTEDCLPDTRENGFVIPPGGARSLPLPESPNDPYAFDDETVAFNCKPL
ncbi:hypothetical protein AB5N19_11441 [Seiridium cardinale]|uniref:Secreted protein n=1 Tax=Seiridium cardinale TaxID=138064 RepID=A0ABR2X9H6_9PEZI